MGAVKFLKTRVSSEMKERVQTLAEQQLITESVWLKRLVAAALRDPNDDGSTQSRAARAIGATRRNWVLEADGEDLRRMRVCVRLRPDDRLLLRERAIARGMPSATYVAVLVRAHLRNLAPLPKDELVALKRSVAELGAVGRNLNQIARAANQGERVVGPAREDLRAILKVCEALRNNVKGLIRGHWSGGRAPLVCCEPVSAVDVFDSRMPNAVDLRAEHMRWVASLPSRRKCVERSTRRTLSRVCICSFARSSRLGATSPATKWHQAAVAGAS
jgi:hypothetical protein